MADSKLTGLTEDTFPTIDDLVYVVNDPDGTPAEKKVTVENLLSLHTPGTLVDRGDPAAYDFTEADLTTDETWRDLDLSSIVPAGVTWIKLRVLVLDGVGNSNLEFRKNGNSNSYSVARSYTQSANVNLEHQFDIPCDANRVIEYWGTNLTFSAIRIQVIGWVTNVNQQVLGFSDKLIDRAGDLGSADFTHADLTMDSSWYGLDLSSIVPAGATFIYLRVTIQDASINQSINFRKNGSSGTFDAPTVRTQVANQKNDASFLVPCDSSRIIEYVTQAGVDDIGISVVGWIMDSAGHGMIDRGDASGWDFVETDLTTDDTWRDLDLSSIVPAGASFVFLGGYIVDDAIGSNLQFRKNGNSNDYHRVGSTTQVVNIGIGIDCTVPCDTNRIIEYNGSNLTFSDIKIVVKGWVI